MGMICRRCGTSLPKFTRVELFRDEAGRQEYHTLEMATWLANKAGRLADLDQWHMSARGSKRGLVMGYEYWTGEYGADGEGKFCGMMCKAADASETSTAPAQHGSPGNNPGKELIPASPVPAKPSADVDAIAFRQARSATGLTQAEFAWALGYRGTVKMRATIVSRFENGARPIPDGIGRLALMYQIHGVPEWANG